MRRAVAGVVLAFAVCSAAAELANGSFDGDAGSIPAGWRVYSGTPGIEAGQQHSGAGSVKLVADGSKRGAGLVQVLEYAQPDTRPIIVGGWSRCQEVSGGGDYAVYLDVFYADGTPWWGRTASWPRGSHGWAYTAAVFRPAKPVRRIEVFVLLRGCTGTAWVDDVFLARDGLYVTDLTVRRDAPRRRGAVETRARLTGAAAWTLTVHDAHGVLRGQARGTGVDLACDATLPHGCNQATVAIRAMGPSDRTLAFDETVDLPVVPTNPVTTGYALWTATGMEKVLPDALPPADGAVEPAIALTLARGEHEGAQVLVTPADALTLRGVTLTGSAVVGADGRPAAGVTVTPLVVGYVRVTTSSGHPVYGGKTGWFPDPLFPARPVDVVGGRTQAFWLDVHASREAIPGTYRTRLSLESANAPPRAVEVRLTVRRFTLPQTPRMRTAFCIMDGFTRKTYGDLGDDLRRQSLDVMLDHRLNPDDISRYDPPRVEDLLQARKRGMNAFNILNIVPRPEGTPTWVCYAGKDVYGPGFEEAFLARARPLVAELRQHGLAELGYFYGFDERGADYDPLIRSICAALKREFPEVHTFTTATYMFAKRREVPADDEDYMDWYCPLTPKYDLELARRLRAAGKQVWWYVCCGPQAPYANFAAVDYPAIEGRLLAWMTYGYESDGLLYWHVNYWQDAPIADWREPYLDRWRLPCIASMTGDGLLVYPLADRVLASSIRLETVRDGSEDYDLLDAVAARHGREAAMGVYRRLVTSLTEYDRDPQVLAAARQALFDLADK